jgi:cytochrome c556
LPILPLLLGLLAVPLAASAHGGDRDEPPPGTPQAARHEAMENNAAAMKATGPMVKGAIPYDAKRAELAMRVLANSSYGFVSLFPEGSDKGKTSASPAVWKDRAKFEAAVKKFGEDAEAAIEAAPKGLDTFKKAFGKVASNCRSCHETFRIKKK